MELPPDARRKLEAEMVRFTLALPQAVHDTLSALTWDETRASKSFLQSSQRYS